MTHWHIITRSIRSLVPTIGDFDPWILRNIVVRLFMAMFVCYWPAQAGPIRPVVCLSVCLLSVSLSVSNI